jgi:hypothetical protein
VIAIAAIDGDAGPVHLIAHRDATDDRLESLYAGVHLGVRPTEPLNNSMKRFAP